MTEGPPNTIKLRIGIDARQFARELAHEIMVGGLTVVDAAERLLEEHLAGTVSCAIGQRLVKRPQAVVHPTYFKRRFETLHGLSQSGYETWYPEVRFSTLPTDEIDIQEIETASIETAPIRYGGGVEHSFHFRKKALRTQTNHLLRLNQVKIAPSVFSETIDQIEPGQGPRRPFIANLTLGPGIVGFRLVAFDHVLTGERIFCACQQSTHEAMLDDALSRSSGFVRGAWPYQFIDALRNAQYVAGICHLCIASESGTEDATAAYGDSVRTHSEAYVDLLARRDKLDPVTARVEAKARLGIARWVREAQLHEVVKKLFPEVAVQREASPIWLGRQRLDIYVPELRLAIEHQGPQHYESVSVFGGDDALQRTKERDLRKRLLCSENGVSVVDVRFDEPLTLAYLRQRLRGWLHPKE